MSFSSFQYHSDKREVRQEIEEYGWTVTVQKSIDQILCEGGVEINQISGMIWSHMHWDHVADLTRFPADVPLIVGPGFTEEFFPGWPEDEESTLDSRAWSNGRPLIELGRLDPTQTASTTSRPQDRLPPGSALQDYLDRALILTIADLPAVDVFSDGSFYLLSTPGHVPSHLCALARTGSGLSSSTSEFILLAADAFDNSGQIRPSPYVFLPDYLTRALSSISKGKTILSRTQRLISETAEAMYNHPFLCPEAENIPQAENSIRGLMQLDARSDVLTLCAHEKYHLFTRESNTNINDSGVPFFPARLNGWRYSKGNGFANEKQDQGKKNLREQLFWWFIRDYGVSVPVITRADEE